MGTLDSDGVIFSGGPNAALGSPPSDQIGRQVCCESGGARATRLSRASRHALIVWLWALLALRANRTRRQTALDVRQDMADERRVLSAGESEGTVCRRQEVPEWSRGAYRR